MTRSNKCAISITYVTWPLLIPAVQNERMFMMKSVLEFQEIAESGRSAEQIDDGIYSWSALSIWVC